jgi:hypothetical protein
MSEINSTLERVEYENLTTTQKRALSELYKLVADWVTEKYEYDADIGSEVYKHIINPDSGGFGDYVGDKEGLNSSVSKFNHVEYQEVDTSHDYDKVLPVSLENGTKQDVLNEIERQLPGLQSESDTQEDTQEDTDNDTQEDTTEEQPEPVSTSHIHEEDVRSINGIGDRFVNKLEKVHEQYGDYTVTEKSFEARITDEYDSITEVINDPNQDANELTEAQVKELSV